LAHANLQLLITSRQKGCIRPICTLQRAGVSRGIREPLFGTVSAVHVDAESRFPARPRAVEAPHGNSSDGFVCRTAAHREIKRTSGGSFAAGTGLRRNELGRAVVGLSRTADRYTWRIDSAYPCRFFATPSPEGQSSFFDDRTIRVPEVDRMSVELFRCRTLPLVRQST